MQDETPKTTATDPALGRSTVARLPAEELREAVDQAIADGATIDEITARIRAEGEECSRSAVGRYTKDMRDLMHRQQEADRIDQDVDAGVRRAARKSQRGAHPHREPLRAMVFVTMGHLGKAEGACLDGESLRGSPSC